MSKKLSALLCGALVSLFMAAGCSKNASTSPKPTRPVTVLLFIDRSGSIVSFPHGGLEGMQDTYQCVAQAFMKPILQRLDGVNIVGYDFVNTYDTLFSVTVDRWEQIRPDVINAVHVPPHLSSEAAGTYYATMIDQVGSVCKSQPDRDIYVLILSDGHPDDSWDTISDSAKRFSATSTGNLKFLMVAPVEPDIRLQWREHLQSCLAPMGTVSIVSSDPSDYQTAITQMLKIESNGGQ